MKLSIHSTAGNVTDEKTVEFIIAITSHWYASERDDCPKRRVQTKIHWAAFMSAAARVPATFAEFRAWYETLHDAPFGLTRVMRKTDELSYKSARDYVIAVAKKQDGATIAVPIDTGKTLYEVY